MKYHILLVVVIGMALSNSVSSESIDHEVRSKILSSFLNSPKKELFKVYHYVFQKHYSLNSEEAIERFKTFKNNLSIIKEHNSKELSYKLEINAFADMSEEEFEKSLGLAEIKDFDTILNSSLKWHYLTGSSHTGFPLTHLEN